MPQKLKELMNGAFIKGQQWVKDGKKAISKFDMLPSKKVTTRVEEIRSELEKIVCDLNEAVGVLLCGYACT